MPAMMNSSSTQEAEGSPWDGKQEGKLELFYEIAISSDPVMQKLIVENGGESGVKVTKMAYHLLLKPRQSVHENDDEMDISEEQFRKDFDQLVESDLMLTSLLLMNGEMGKRALMRAYRLIMLLRRATALEAKGLFHRGLQAGSEESEVEEIDNDISPPEKPSSCDATIQDSVDGGRNPDETLKGRRSNTCESDCDSTTETDEAGSSSEAEPCAGPYNSNHKAVRAVAQFQKDLNSHNDILPVTCHFCKMTFQHFQELESHGKKRPFDCIIRKAKPICITIN